MTIRTIAKQFYREVKPHVLRMAGTFSRFDKGIRYEIPDKVPGIYFICRSNGKVAYIGETGRCIKRRIARHKRSMNDPTWGGECSGLKFVEAGIQDEDFILKFIPAKALKLKCKHDLLAAEGLLVTALKPMVYKK